MPQSSEFVLGTVTGVNPLRVRADAASSDDPAVPCSMVQAVVDARAVCLRVGKRLYLIATASSTTAYVPAQTRAAAAPTDGSGQTGDICWNTAPATGTPAGWVCSSPGVWRSFGSAA